MQHKCSPDGGFGEPAACASCWAGAWCPQISKRKFGGGKEINFRWAPHGADLCPSRPGTNPLSHREAPYPLKRKPGPQGSGFVLFRPGRAAHLPLTGPLLRHRSPFSSSVIVVRSASIGRDEKGRRGHVAGAKGVLLVKAPPWPAAGPCGGTTNGLPSSIKRFATVRSEPVAPRARACFPPHRTAWARRRALRRHYERARRSSSASNTFICASVPMVMRR